MRNKVTEFVIEPLNDWFAKKITEGQAAVYGEVLEKYSPEILQKAIKELKSTWVSKFIPLPANVREVCDRLIPKIKPLTRYEKATMDFWQAAAKIMPTEVGRLALSECWARSLVCEVMSSGKTEFTEREINKFREGRRNADNVARNLSASNQEDKVLLQLWWTMQEKEQELINRYSAR